MGRGTPPDHILLSGPPGLGKPVSVDALVLLRRRHAAPARRHRGRRPGDHPHRRAGAWCEAVHEQGELDCVRIRTATGREVVAAPDHPFWTHRGLGQGRRPHRRRPAGQRAAAGRRGRSTETADEFRAGRLPDRRRLHEQAGHVHAGDEAMLDDFRATAIDSGTPHITRPNSARSSLVRVSGLRGGSPGTGCSTRPPGETRVPAFVFRGDAWQVRALPGRLFRLRSATVSRRGRRPLRRGRSSSTASRAACWRTSSTCCCGSASSPG